MKTRPFASLVFVLAAGSCIPLPSAVRAPMEIWTVFPPGVDRLDYYGRSPSDTPLSGPVPGCSAIVDKWVALDSVTLKPALLAPLAARPLATERTYCGATAATTAAEAFLPRRTAVITTFQGARYRPETIRALGESRDALSRTAAVIARLATDDRTQGVLLDFQEMSGDDLPALMDVSRAIADSVRAISPALVGIIVPGSDRAGYPGRTLARVADVLLVRIFPEHGPANPPGPIVSPSWFVRRLGARAGEVGVNRVVAGVPADGVLWNARGPARTVSYAEALRLAEAAGVPVLRDPASGNLHAVSARDGWEVWVSDHELVTRLIAEGRRIGVTRFAVFGLVGADPKLWQSLPQLVR